MEKLKSSRLSKVESLREVDDGEIEIIPFVKSWVVILSLVSNINNTSKYEADVEDCGIFDFQSCEWIWLYLIDIPSSIYRNIELKATARYFFFSCEAFE
jgi:hypothetical protein